ncbi:FAD-dependent oxidoreductase [Rhodococcus sp. NPDC057529]|uniref:FAD-dependent oxidoreductase n=1 Tax=Rhodococcus sp. NPDC057529 TaxID=3346158 RepID=UPI0036735D65
MSLQTNDYDVVVIGYGGAGASAAIEAHEAGARVLVLEKAPEGGGTTAMAGGNIRTVRDADKMIKHFHTLCEGTTDLASVEAHVRGLIDLPAWIEKGGGVIAPDKKKVAGPPVIGPPYPRETPGTLFPRVEGADGVGVRYRWPQQNGHDRGAAGYAMLARNVAQRGIDVVTGARVTSLVRDGVTGRVSRVHAEHDGQEIHIDAKSGVVLASGGYSWDADLLRDTIGAVLPSASPPHRNTGDGVRIAQAVGAGLWHMGAAVLQLGVVVPDYEASFGLKVRERGFVLVDRLGQRFCDETNLAGHDGGVLLDDRDLRGAVRKRLPSYLVFDEATRIAGPVVTPDRGFNRDSGWSDDNSMPVERGWIASAPTVRGLAGKLGLDADELTRTIDTYNRGAAAGHDAYGRAAAECTPLEDGPFYGIAVWPCILNTQGGPRRSPAGHILDPWGTPIPGLFGAGELGSIWNTLYPGGVNYGEALVSGRVAGASAVGVVPA